MCATQASAPLEVVIAGGGVAGLETAMALRALAGDRVRTTLLTPERDFVYRPLAVAQAFELGEARRYPLAHIARDFNFELVHGELDRVEPDAHMIVDRSGGELAYEALVVATGARPRPAWDHTLTFAGPRDAEAMAALVRSVEARDVERVGFVVPGGVTWPLPLYELALMTAARATAAGRRPELVLYTPETEPLGLFGPEASADVGAQLEAAGVRLVLSSEVDVTAKSEVMVPGRDSRDAYERIVALPRLEGRAPPGLPNDDAGFLPIDRHGAVHGVAHVYAAGDGTDFPVKQGGIASQQADAVAELIARRAGASVDPQPFHGLLRSQLFTGAEPRFLRTDLSLRASAHSQASEIPLWWPVAKIAGLHLAPYLAAQDGAPSQAREVDEKITTVVFLPEDFENNPWGE
jgi:sulfide:quinone oxidoreductase